MNTYNEDKRYENSIEKEFNKERAERAQNFYKELETRKIAEKRTISNNVKKSSKKRHLTARGKNALKKGALTAGVIAAGLSISFVGNKIIVARRYQKNIDKYVENKLEQEIEIPENMKLNEEQREELAEYLTAVQICEDKKGRTWQETNNAEELIINYTDSGKAIESSKAVLSAQISNAKKYGDWGSQYERNQTSATDIVEYVDDMEEQGFHIKDVTGKMYTTSNFEIFEESIPKNLRNLTRDILDAKKRFKDRDDCLGEGLKIGGDLSKVVYEFYIIDEKGNLNRINEKDFNKKKEKYDKIQQEQANEVREKIAKEYGISVPTARKIEDEGRQ